MKPAVFGTMHLPFKRVVDPMDMDVAMLQTGYLLHGDAIKSIEIVVKSIYGQETRVKALDWEVVFDGLYDENGVLVE